MGKLVYEFSQNVFDEIGTLRTEFYREVIGTLAHLIRLTLREISDQAALGTQKPILCGPADGPANFI